MNSNHSARGGQQQYPAVSSNFHEEPDLNEQIRLMHQESQMNSKMRFKDGLREGIKAKFNAVSSARSQSSARQGSKATNNFMKKNPSAQQLPKARRSAIHAQQMGPNSPPELQAEKPWLPPQIASQGTPLGVPHDSLEGDPQPEPQLAEKVMGMFDKEAEEQLDQKFSEEEIEKKLFEFMDKIYFKGNQSRSRSPIPSSSNVQQQMASMASAHSHPLQQQHQPQPPMQQPMAYPMQPSPERSPYPQQPPVHPNFQNYSSNPSVGMTSQSQGGPPSQTGISSVNGGGGDMMKFFQDQFQTYLQTQMQGFMSLQQPQPAFPPVQQPPLPQPLPSMMTPMPLSQPHHQDSPIRQTPVGYPQGQQPVVDLSGRESGKSADIDSIRKVTETLGEELKQMRKQIQDVQMSSSEKDAHIIQLNMHLADEKKRNQDIIRSQKSISRNLTPQSRQAVTNQKEGSLYGNDSLLTDNMYQQKEREHKERESELKTENSALKKKVDSLKKTVQLELTHVKQLKKINKELTSQLTSMPDLQRKAEEDLSHKNRDIELKYLTKMDKQKTHYEEAIKKLEEDLRHEKVASKSKVQDCKMKIKQLEAEIEKALRIHKANAALQTKAEHLVKELARYKELNQKAKEQLEAKSSKVQELTLQVNHLEAEREKTQQIIDLQKQTFKEKEEHIKIESGLTGLSTKVCQNCVETFQEKEKIYLKLQQAEVKINSLQDELKSGREQVADSYGDASINVIKDLREKLDVKTEQNSLLEHEVDQLKKERDLYKKQTESLNSQILQNLQESPLGKEEDNVAQLEIEELKRRVAEVDQEKQEQAADFEQKIGDLEKEVQRLAAELEAKPEAPPAPDNSEEIKALEQEISSLGAQLKESQDQVAQLSSQVDKLTGDLKSREKQVQDLEQKLEDQHSEEEGGDAYSDSSLEKTRKKPQLGLAQQIKEKDDLIAQLQKEIEEKDVALGQWAAKTQADTEEKINLQMQVGDLNNSLAEAKKKLNGLLTELEQKNKFIDNFTKKKKKK